MACLVTPGALRAHLASQMFDVGHRRVGGEVGDTGEVQELFGGHVDFRVLGPVAVLVDGRPMCLGGSKPRTLLAMLVMNVGRVVPLDALISALWGQQPPNSARAMVHTYVSTLRRVLAEHQASGGAIFLRQAPGYVLRIAPELVDLTRFNHAVHEGSQALRAENVELASAWLANAMTLWTGLPLGGVEGQWAELERVKLTEARLAAWEMRLDADFRLGRGRTLVGELSALVADHPLREPLRARLMFALCAAGRQADALEMFHQTRRMLVEELGVEPGQELQAALRTVLEQTGPTVALQDHEWRAAEEPLTAIGPRQLPATIADFSGRVNEVDQIVGVLRSTADRCAAPICAVSGKPGAGKTAMAVHVAHLVRHEYPDGQLYATLSGIRGTQVDPADVLARFLRALGIADAAIPVHSAERLDLYRSVLVERRVLVVLDDALNEQQIRPLIPSGAGCAMLVTSRIRLAALEGARLFDVRELREDEALELLARLISSARLEAEPEAAREIVRLCGHLPLAVRIAGARLVARPHWTISRLVQRLREQRHVLNELAIGDLEVRGSLALSYDGLTELERTALRRLSLIGVPEFASWLAASLLDLPVGHADDVVERLVDAQLLDVLNVDAAGLTRCRFHDLTRAFARELGEAEVTRTDVRDAIDRTCQDALELVRHATAKIPGVVIRPLPDMGGGRLDASTVDALLADAGAWFDAEQGLLINLVELASELNLVDTAAALASTLSSSSFAVRNQFSQWHRSHTAALGAARRAGDRSSEAQLLAGIGQLYYEQDRFDESMAYYQQALAAYLDVGDVGGQARTRLELSIVLRERGWFTEAENMLAEATPVLRWIGTAAECAQATYNIGMLRTEQGAFIEAADRFGTAMATYRSIGDRRGAALALRSIGIVHRAAGRLDEAATCCEQALKELRAVDAPLMVAYAKQALAKVRIRQGGAREVRRTLDEALKTCNEMQDGFGQALIHRTIGELELASADPETALRHLTGALEWWQALDLPVWQARTTRDMTIAWTLLGDKQRADSLWTSARAVFEQYGCREATEALPDPIPHKL